MMRLLLPLVPLYAAAAAAKNVAYERGWARARGLAHPVVSVGNLSVGGAGKTPLVIRLAQLLTAAGIAVDVLSRGYGRSETNVERVDPDGDAARYGDEPLLIARAAGVPVYVGASRYEAGLRAERDAPNVRLHLLDDGFQHRKLARAMDIVVVHRSDLDEHLLPAGRLREPLASLRRASAVVLRAADRDLEVQLRALGIAAPFWVQHRRLVVESGTRAVAFCGIARPEEFFAALRGQSVELAATLALRDHQKYSRTEIDRIADALGRSGAGRLITTEKDLARMTGEQRARLAAAAPLSAARLEVSLEDEDAIVGQILNLLVRK